MSEDTQEAAQPESTNENAPSAKPQLKVYRVELQGQIAPIGYQAGSSLPSVQEPAQYFDSLESAERYLGQEKSCDLARALDNGQFRSYKSHLGTFVLNEVNVRN